MDLKIIFLTDIIESVTEDCIYEGTDYMGFMDIEYCTKNELDFKYKKYGVLSVPLFLKNREIFIRYLKKNRCIIFSRKPYLL